MGRMLLMVVCVNAIDKKWSYSTMRRFKACPLCDAVGTVKFRWEKVTVKVRGHNFRVLDGGFECSACKVFFWADGNPRYDGLEKAYKLYEKKFGVDVRYKGKDKV